MRRIGRRGGDRGGDASSRVLVQYVSLSPTPFDTGPPRRAHIYCVDEGVTEGRMRTKTSQYIQRGALPNRPQSSFSMREGQGEARREEAIWIEWERCAILYTSPRAPNGHHRSLG